MKEWIIFDELGDTELLKKVNDRMYRYTYPSGYSYTLLDIQDGIVFISYNDKGKEMSRFSLEYCDFSVLAAIVKVSHGHLHNHKVFEIEDEVV